MRQLLRALLLIAAGSAVTPPLRTSGNQILDADGEAVRLACVNWYGAHMERFVVNGLDQRPVGDIAQDVADLGFNCVRLVFSHDLFFKSPNVKEAAVSANPDFVDRPAMEVFDATVEALTSAGVMVILNNHISDAGWCCGKQDGNGLWYTDSYPASAFNEMWVALARRYKANKLVVGADLRNELREANGVSPTWGDGNVTTDWKMAAEECGNAVLSENSDLLIIVEGLDYDTSLLLAAGVGASKDVTLPDPHNYVRRHPVQLSVPNRLVYEGHVYSWDGMVKGLGNYSLFMQAMHMVETYVTDPDHVYTAPFWLGEFGTHTNLDANACWNNTIEMLARHPEFGWAYWALDGYKHQGGEGDDETYGIFEMDYKTIRDDWKLRDLQSVQPARQSGLLTV